MVKECTIIRNKSNCSFTYEACSRRGLCCECIAYHNRLDEVPGCLFPSETEKTYNRSRINYIRAWTK